MKRVSILGSTGSIGSSTLSVIDRNPNTIRVHALAAGRNVNLLKEQMIRYQPSVVSITDENQVAELKSLFPEVQILCGDQGLLECAVLPEVDIVVVGVVGFAAMAPTLAAIKANKTLALANKEVLVAGGELLQAEIGASSAKVIPVDSEHNALYQLLQGRSREEVDALVLTASGGPLFKCPDMPLEDVTPDFAIRHPNWSMGPKISVDSATMMNKGLELIEAHYLFQYPETKIEVWVHPQSIVHGAIWFKDGTCMAQLSKPDMCSSLGFALAFPNRFVGVVNKLKLSDFQKLEFFEPDALRFPCLQLAREALRSGASSLIALNAANEVVVQAFLAGRVLFNAIPRVIEACLSKQQSFPIKTITDVFECDKLARELAMAQIPGFGLTPR